jgi:membrane fusion protein (multidrug efflux system)
MMKMRLAILTVLIVCIVTPAARAEQEQPAAVAVGTVAAQLRPIARTAEFVGRVEAIERVDIRARVKGYLDQVLFKDGQAVKSGEPLYRIEQDLFQADVQRAEGALERSKASLNLAILQRQRAVELLAKAAGTVVARDQAVALEAQSRGAVLTDEANLTTAKINLGYTDIRSPITGRIGRSAVTKGNVVGPDSGVLATIVSEDPIYVTFPVSQREFLESQQTGKGSDVATIKVRLRFSDGKLYKQEGRINFVDVKVDRATDTVLARATVQNPDEALIDGQLMTVVLEAGKADEKVTVPQSALIADQAGTYVFIVEGGKAAVRRVVTRGASGTDAVIDSGLKGGEPVIVEGLQAVRPGIAVKATPVPGQSSEK